MEPKPEQLNAFSATRRVFIDRKSLRQALKELTSGDGPRVLVVDGPPGSGKSYTSEFIFDLLAKTPNAKAVYAQFHAVDFSPLDLTRVIAAHMGRSIDSIPIQNNEQSGRWISILCDWITAEIVKDSGIDWWFIFDQLDDPNLAPELLALVEELAVRAETSVPRLRLVLLGYRNKLPLQIDDFVLREDLQPFGRPELHDFFRELFNSEGVVYSPHEIETLVDQILSQTDQALADVPNRDAGRLRYVNRAVHTAVRNLFPQ